MSVRLCRSLSNSQQGSMYLLDLEPMAMSAEPTSSLYESADQPLSSSSASPQCTSRLNFEESQIAVVMLMMPGSCGLTKTSNASSRAQQARIDPLPSGAAQLNHIGDELSVCFQTPRVCCQTPRRQNRLLLICHHNTDCNKGSEYPHAWFATGTTKQQNAIEIPL